MFDDLFAELEGSLSNFVESDIFQIGIRVLVIYVVLIWLASAFWAYRDMRLRSASAITPYVAAAAIIVFTPIFFLFGVLLYRIVRPKETIAEVNERALAEEALLSEIASRSHCANCSRPVHEEWIICPTCRNRLRRVCPNCEHLIELDWTLCAWCGRDFERAEAPGAAAYMPSARPAAPRPQQPGLRLPPPPTQTRPAPSQATPGTPLPGASSKPATGALSSPPTPPTRPQAAATASQPSSSPAPRSSRAAASTSSSAASQPAGGAQPASGAPSATGI